MLGIVVSRADEASVHVGEHLRAAADWTERTDDARADADGGGAYWTTDDAALREFDALHIDLEDPAAAFDDPDLVAVASRHSGETGPLLTAHHTGNLGPAAYGGEPNALAMAAPRATATALAALDDAAPEGYDVGLECTHHGPTAVDVPLLFVEVGSEEAQWRDPAAARAVADAILALRDVDPLDERTLVGLGGGHYAPRFTRIVRETGWAVGHIAADWGLRSAEDPDDALLRALFERSGATRAVVDGDHPDLVERVEALGYHVVSETWVRETDGVPLDLVAEAEAALSSVEAGLRFGAQARDAGGLGDVDEGTGAAGRPFAVIEPAPDLLADACGIDAERVREAVEAAAVAYETVEAGNRVEGRVAVADGDAWRRVEAVLVDLLRERYVSVAAEDDAIVVTERAFDPDRARALGVEPGPAFGRLAGGQAVTVGDRTVEPEAVHTTRTRRYPRTGPPPV